MPNIITKLFTLFILSILLASCINNGDEPPVKPIIPAIPLTKQSLAGEWEVYYFFKKIKPNNGGESNYRYTEYDGFKVTFTADGKYSEYNVVGHETQKGTYKIINFAKEKADYDTKNKAFSGASENSDLNKDGLLLTYEVTDTITGLKKDTTVLVNIPKLFGKNFAYRDEYIGGAQGHSYTLVDNRDYRRVGSGFLPDETMYEKNMIDINDLLGRWEMTSNVVRTENTVTTPSFKRDRHLFKMEGNKLAYYLYAEKDWTTKPNPEPVEEGEFQIFDDVINMFTYTYEEDEKGNPTDKIKTITNYKLWIKDKIDTDQGALRMRSYDKYRDIQNTLLEVEEFQTFKKLSNN